MLKIEKNVNFSHNPASWVVVGGGTLGLELLFPENKYNSKHAVCCGAKKKKNCGSQDPQMARMLQSLKHYLKYKKK